MGQYTARVNQDVELAPAMLRDIEERITTLHSRGDLHSLMILRHMLGQLDHVQTVLKRNCDWEGNTNKKGRKK